ncbi:MAG TPA: phospho-sugar mutase [Myxococcales bacterium]|nr:phosphomannomutase [Myxococcales bacterium]HAN32456.1 phospho-sugar mutase [Myxococcales bacterium]
MTTNNRIEEFLSQADEYLRQEPEASLREELSELCTRAQAGDAVACEELADRFTGSLRFGTAGLRGRVEGGTNRINRVVVARASWGLGRHLLQGAMGVSADRGVVIGFDGRRMSRQFAEDTAAVLAALGVPCWLFPVVVPTPLCAYAVRALKAAAGVMVTASHNPPRDNGYKVYQATGGQIIAPHDSQIASWIDQAPSQIDRLCPFEAAQAGLRKIISESVTEEYLSAVGQGALHPGVLTRQPISVVYTAMHGVGHALVERALRGAGLKGLTVVPSQTEPDGAFPTVSFPNPEEPGAMDRAVALAKETFAPVIVANDPDADRLAVAIRQEDGDYRQLTGNEVGALLGHDALAYMDTGDAPKLAVTTIVSSTMLSRIAEDLGHRYAETLTGFKWLADAAIRGLKERGEHFVFGFEEALGYSVGPLVRDKDGVSAIVRFVELCAWLQEQGRSPQDELDRLSLAHGLSVGQQWSARLPGQQGLAQIQQIMESLRQRPLTELAGVPVVARCDLKDGSSWAQSDPERRSMELPAANVLVYYDAEGTRLVVRPSGTEPKIKLYLESVGWPKQKADIDAVTQERKQRLEQIRAAINVRLGLD